ncbi:MAG: glucokinase [Acidobacteriota bacterium]
MRVIAGDIGGTKTRLGLFEISAAGVVERTERTFASADHAGLDEIVAAFISEVKGACERAAFAIAGPVTGRTARTTNLPWLVDADAMESSLKIARVSLLNDLEAVAYGIAELGETDLVVLHPGAPGAAGNAAVIAAGTGLGMAGLFWDGSRHRPFATEGGHADFAPLDDEQDALRHFLAARFDHVSTERVLSGPGLVHIFEFLLDSARNAAPPWLLEARAGGDPAAAIAERALAGTAPLATRALDMFVSIYGAEAANLALTMMARGGIYVGGGIAPKILAALTRGPFLTAFLAKGRMRPVLEAMPVKVIVNDRAALLGAARVAALAGDTR